MTIKTEADVPRLLEQLRQQGFYGEVTLRLKNGRVGVIVTTQTHLVEGDRTPNGNSK